MDNKEQELQEIAERLMQSENLAASVEILREFAEKCWQEGACEAQNDAAKYIKNTSRGNLGWNGKRLLFR